MLLTTALDDVDVHVVNAKGVKLDDTVVMVRLGKLEGLLHELDELRGLLDEMASARTE